MRDNIEFEIVWQDSDLVEVAVSCSTEKICASNKIYFSYANIMILYSQLGLFLQDDNLPEFYWESGPRGNSTTACISLKFLRKDHLGHFLIEVFMELDDGGDYISHNCCFYITTETESLLKFMNQLPYMQKYGTGFVVSLN